MPKKKIPTVNLREEQYVEKAFKWRTGGGLAPEDVRRKSEAVVNKMYGSWKGIFGRFSEVWWNAVKPVLDAHEVPALDYAKYKAFVNRYISKCLIKKSQKPENVKADFSEIHNCDAGILDEITQKIGEVW